MKEAERQLSASEVVERLVNEFNSLLDIRFKFWNDDILRHVLMQAYMTGESNGENNAHDT